MLCAFQIVQKLSFILTLFPRELVISRHQLVANAEVHGSQLARSLPILDVGDRRKAAFIHFFHFIFISNLFPLQQLGFVTLMQNR